MDAQRWLLRSLLTNQFVAATLLILFVTLVILLTPIAYMIVKNDISVEFLSKPLAFSLIALAGGYGVLRGAINHPVFDDRYRQWLANSPWTPKKPLPKGPIHTGWADLIGIVVLSAICSALALTIDIPRWPYVVGPAVAFSCGLTLVWSLANGSAGQTAVVYAVLVVPLLIRFFHIHPFGYLICPFVTAAIAWFGVRRSLEAFPWEDRQLNTTILIRKSRYVGDVVDWPFRELLKPLKDIRVPGRQALFEGVILASWLWTVLSSGQATDEGDLSAIMVPIAIATGAGALTRLLKYGPVICSQLCLGHRIANKQWIVPQHDQIFVAPLLMIAVGWFLPRILVNLLGFSIPLACGLTAGIVLMIGRSMGPNLDELQFTGVHSKSGALAMAKQKEFVTTRGS